MDAIHQKHRRMWWALAVRGLLALAVGALILAFPRDSLGALALIVALWALVTGMTEIVHALETKSMFRTWWVLLLGGLISMGFGVTAIYYYPVLSLAFMTVWVALSLATSGAVVVYSSVQMRHAGISWFWTCTWGVLSLVVSVVALINPPATLGAILELLAIFLIVCGSVLLMAAWRIRAFTKHLAAALHIVAPP
jgi:uncharacterized membrane protein HdeD (DUF308 family)